MTGKARGKEEEDYGESINSLYAANKQQPEHECFYPNYLSVILRGHPAELLTSSEQYKLTGRHI